MEEQKFLYTIYYRLYIIFLNYVTLNKHIYYYYYIIITRSVRTGDFTRYGLYNYDMYNVYQVVQNWWFHQISSL